MSFRIVVEKNLLAQIVGDLRPKAGALIRKTALAVKAGAQQNIVVNDQVDTGAMLNSPTVENDGPFRQVVAFGVEYAIHQEYGTAHQPGRPFLGPAVEAQREPLQDGLKDLVKP